MVSLCRPQTWRQVNNRTAHSLRPLVLFQPGWAKTPDGHVSVLVAGESNSHVAGGRVTRRFAAALTTPVGGHCHWPCSVRAVAVSRAQGARRCGCVSVCFLGGGGSGTVPVQDSAHVQPPACGETKQSYYSVTWVFFLFFIHGAFSGNVRVQFVSVFKVDWTWW